MQHIDILLMYQQENGEKNQFFEDLLVNER